MTDKLRQPLNRLGGCNYRNYELMPEHNAMRFVPTTQAKSLLLVLGFGSAAIFVLVPVMMFLQGAGISDFVGIGSLVYGLCFAGFIWFSRWIWRKSRSPVCFDRANGRFYVGKAPNDKSIRLSDLSGVQVIRKSVRTDNRIYHSYELNVVRKDSERFKVMDHAQRDHLKSEAEQLAKFLNVEYEYIDSTES